MSGFQSSQEQGWEFMDMLTIICSFLQIYSVGMQNQQGKDTLALSNQLNRIEQKLDQLIERRVENAS